MNDKLRPFMERVAGRADLREVNVSLRRYSRAIPKQCYNNTFKFITDNPARCKYALGFLVLYGAVPIEHAWVVHPKEGHLDVTIREKQEGDFYVLAHVLKWEWVVSFALNKGYPPSMYDVAVAGNLDKITEATTVPPFQEWIMVHKVHDIQRS